MKTSNDFARLITPESINISWEGKNRIITRDNPQYAEVLHCIREGLWDELEEKLDLAAGVEAYSDGLFRVDGGQVYVKQESGEFKVPTELNDRILYYMEEKLPFDSLINFALKLAQNPSYNSIQQLFQFIERHQFTLMENGNFLAYKRVKPDFTDCHTGTFDNSIGNTVSMPRNQISDNPNDGCSAGLHCANFHYASTFYAGAAGRLLELEVNPKDVVSVPNDCDFEKIRVCEYLVLRLCSEEYKKPLYPEELNDKKKDGICGECRLYLEECECDEICQYCDQTLVDCADYGCVCPDCSNLDCCNAHGQY